MSKEESYCHTQTEQLTKEPAESTLSSSNQTINAKSTSLHVGPLPSPQLLAKYEKILTGLSDRIVKMAENEAAHRHQTETKWLNKTFVQQRLGQVFGLVIGMTAIIVGGIVAVKGAEFTGSLYGTGGVAALVWAFIQGSKTKK